MTARGIEVTLGLVLVTSKVKLAVTVSLESDTITDIVYMPTSMRPTDVALISNGFVIVNNSPGIVFTTPPFS